ncbi:Uncharacterised protein [Chryseobacterium nakagawai]|uniref:Uncharacterized protein n=1 Tax=Chryseobacterium nakagawai TaxID=1241982 RepID=A0AAD0YPK5_CHRNA|nr:hypothetical protein [Chryseobacterium nakagawai]AZA92785.1 hypothetical protein EG343_20410 [Chryseobacterium nakagawai]VEH19392.1 Uncharacterised protein [Chryseobacterium nakagawai]
MKKQTLLFGLLLLSFSNTNAQLLNKIMNAKTQVSQASKVVEKGAEIVKRDKNKKGSSSAGLKLDWSTFKQTPAVTFNSLLYGTTAGTIDSYTATFIPNKTVDGRTVSPITDQAEYLKIKVYKNNQYMNYFEYSGDQVFDDGKKTKFNAPSSRYKRDDEFVGRSESFITQWGPGNYRLDFYAGDKMFYSFDFELVKLTNNDPYAAINEMYVTRGPWNNFAYINYADTGNLVFGYYITHEEFQPNPANNRKTNKSVKWSVKMFKDNKLYAQNYGNGPSTAQVEQGKWNDVSCAFKLIDKPGEVKFSSLTDGAYKIELSVEGENKPRVYNFTVKDKRIVQIPEQDRSKNTDPTRLIEGWNDFFWLKLEK